jgi:peptide deformylase
MTTPIAPSLSPVAPVSVSELAAAAAGPFALVPLDHPALRRRARPLAEEAFGSPALGRYIERLWAVLGASERGVGLAAPQVGHDFAIFLVDYEDERLALANPRRVGLPGFERLLAEEGCLSIPGFRAALPRAATLTVSGRDPAGGAQVQVFGRGFRARILAHETDHLAGRLYIDLIDPGALVATMPVAILTAPPDRAPAEGILDTGRNTPVNRPKRV